MSYTVYLDENSHTADDEGRYRHGEYETAEAAIAECRRIVDDFLEPLRKPGTSSEELFRSYCLFAEEPFVVSSPPVRFSAREYALERCKALGNPRAAVTREKLPPAD
jgi:hypothetical protein